MVNANDKGERKVTSLRELPQAVSPPRDLWAGIEARIAAEKQGAEAPAGRSRRGFGFGRSISPTQFRWMAAAAMIATLAVGMWIGRSSLPIKTPNGGNETVAHQPPAAVNSGGAAAMQAAFFADPKYRSQREALVKSLEAKLTSLPPDSRAKVLSSLATIHKSMQDLEAELGKDPTNALLQELLVNTYQDEMRVLTTVHEASNPGEGI